MSTTIGHRQVDVLVVGAGVVGASTAAAARHTGADVLLVDRAAHAGAGSRAAAGVGVPSVRLLSDPPMFAFAQAGSQVLRADLDRLSSTGRRLGVPTGVLRPLADETAARRLAEQARTCPELLGDWLDRDEVLKLEPGWRGKGAGAYHQPEALMVDAAGYVDALVAEARTAGVAVELDSEAIAVQDDPAEAGSPVTVRLGSGTVTAGQVVLATGAALSTLPGALTPRVRPLRGQMIRVEPADVTDRPTRIVSGSLYVAPAPDGRTVLVGATEEDVDFEPGPTVEGALVLLAHLAREWPALRGARLVDVWAGHRAVSPDGRPWIGRLPRRPEVLVASGHGGQGILTGAHTGRLVGRLVNGESVPEVAPFAPDRGEG